MFHKVALIDAFSFYNKTVNKTSRDINYGKGNVAYKSSKLEYSIV